MLIKSQALPLHLKREIKAIYMLVGVDYYLLNQAVTALKEAWKQQEEIEEKILVIQNATDWNNLIDEANHYSLFADKVLLDVRFEKKTIDAAAKALLNSYLQHSNPRCLIILQAIHVPVKQLQWFQQHEQGVLVQITPLTGHSLQQWIVEQLKQRRLPHAPEVPELIFQYSQNNLLACAQTIEKLALISDGIQALSVAEVEAQLIDQCEFQVYELADACLGAHTDKAIHLLRQAQQHRIEPTLILWLLTQECRQLIQLMHLVKQQSLAFMSACKQLNIWPKRAPGYEKALKRLTLPQLYELLLTCKHLDEQIKTNSNYPIWIAFERLAITLCIGVL